MKYIIIIAILLAGCEQQDDTTGEYDQFITEYGTDNRYYCDEEIGFLMRESIGPDDDTSIKVLVLNGAKDPVLCPECEND